MSVRATAALALRRSYVGVAVSFDDATGIGSIELFGGVEVGFHCTQIADGTRTIGPGSAVVCRLAAVNLGVIEAVDIRPAG